MNVSATFLYLYNLRELGCAEQIENGRGRHTFTFAGLLRRVEQGDMLPSVHPAS